MIPLDLSGKVALVTGVGDEMSFAWYIAKALQAAGKRFRADAVRQQLRRARLRFAELLVQEVARGIDDPTPARLEEELIDVGLMEYVRDFLPADWRTTGELRELA